MKSEKKGGEKMTAIQLDKQIERLQNQRNRILSNERAKLVARIEQIDSILGSTGKKSVAIAKKPTKSTANRIKRGTLLTEVRKVLQTAQKPMKYTEITAALKESGVKFGASLDDKRVCNNLYVLATRTAKTGIRHVGNGNFEFVQPNS